MLDTAAFITAMRSPAGAARRLLELILQGQISILMDHKLSLEYRDVALRKEHLAAAALSKANMSYIIELLEDIAIPVEIARNHRPLSIDPDDDMVLDLAINGDAEIIVTGNRKHFVSAARRFGILVLSPAQMLERLRKESTHVH